MEGADIPFIGACAWTTEAIYREYPKKLRNWKVKGGEIVNMATSFQYAVYKKLDISNIYTCIISNSLFKPNWDYKFPKAENQTPKLFNLAVDILLNKKGHNEMNHTLKGI